MVPRAELVAHISPTAEFPREAHLAHGLLRVELGALPTLPTKRHSVGPFRKCFPSGGTRAVPASTRIASPRPGGHQSPRRHSAKHVRRHAVNTPKSAQDLSLVPRATRIHCLVSNEAEQQVELKELSESGHKSPREMGPRLTSCALCNRPQPRDV